MGKNKPSAQTLTRYVVHSTNTGALVCGPYDSEPDAKRERDRLNREAAQCRTAPSERHPQGQSLSWHGLPELLHDGQLQEYAVREVAYGD